MSIPDFVTIGVHSYFGSVAFHRWGNERISIGKFCSISQNVQMLAGGNHKTTAVSTFPFDTMLTKQASNPMQDRSYELGEGIEIGNDVWIGTGASIVGHIKIGHGAVIAANATVFSDVPPYAVYGGNPARLLRFRFAEDEIQELLGIAWWNWDTVTIKARVDDFYLPIRGFCRKYGSLSGFALCPKCGRMVATRRSDCPCADCSTILYFSDHDHDGAQCFGSGHGVKQPETVHA